MIEIRTLGELSVSDEGRRVRLATRKHYALLIYLAAHPDRPFLRDRLAALFWGDSPDKRARHSLNQTLYGIRRGLPTLRLQVSTQEVLLPAGAAYVDFIAFRHAVAQQCFREASSMYSGDFLDGFSVPDSHEFEEWQETERESLKRQALLSLSSVMEEEESAGNWTMVEELATRMIRIDPFTEAAHRARIRAIAASGDARRARAEWRRSQATLGSELRGSIEQILSTVKADLDDEVVQDIGGIEGDDQSSATKFIGRAEPFRLLRTEWRKAQSGHGRVVIVSGEPGIGKTRLCHQFLRLAAVQGGRCFQGRCYSTERSVPFSGIVDALASGLRSRDVESLSPRWASALAEMLPQVEGKVVSESPSFDREEYRMRILEALVQAVVAVSAKSSVVLFIDDVQWADHSTLTVLHYMARRLANHPVLIIIALRSDELAANTQLSQLRAELLRRHCVEISLTEMDHNEARLLISSFSERQKTNVPKVYEEEILTRVGGRPFFIIELLRAYADSKSINREGRISLDADVADPLPQSIRTFLENRLAQMSHDETQVLGALAVLGKGATFELLRIVGGMDELATFDAISRLIRKGIARDDGLEIAFTHDLLREAAYRWIGAYRRRVLHERAARALANDSQTPPGILATHYHSARNKALAFQYALMAAEASDKVRSDVEAEFYLRMAVDNVYDDSSRVSAFEHFAYFLFRTRRYDEAQTYFESMEQHFQLTGQRKGLLVADVNRIAASLHRGEISARNAVKGFEACVRAAEEIGERDLVSRILRHIINAAHLENDRDMVLKWTNRLIEKQYVSERTHDTIRNLSSAAITIGIYKSAREGLEIANRACDLCTELDDRIGLVYAARARAGNRMYLGMLSLARTDVIAADEMADQMDNLRASLDIWTIGALLSAACGRWEEAEGYYNRVVKEVGNKNEEFYLIIANANRMIMEYERGRNEQAEELGRRLLELNQTLSSWWFDLTAWSILGLCALGRGDVEEARRCRREVLLRYEGRDFWISDVSYAEIFLARLSSLEGEVEGAVGRLEEAIAAYEDRDVLCRSRMRLERARLLQELDPVESRREAEAVYAAAVEMGARPLVEKAEAVLRRAAGAGRATRVRSAR